MEEAKKRLAGNLCVNTGQGSGGGFTSCGTPAATLTKGVEADREAAPVLSHGAALAKAGKITEVSPEVFKAALTKNARADTLSDYPLDELAKMKLFMLNGHDAGYAIKGGDELVNLFNNGGSGSKGAGPWLVLHAVEQGARRGDHFDGFLTDFYKSLGFVEEKREANWTPGGPDVIYIKWAGGDPKVASALYRQHGRVVPSGVRQSSPVASAARRAESDVDRSGFTSCQSGSTPAGHSGGVRIRRGPDTLAELKKRLAGNLCVNTGSGSGGGFTSCNTGGAGHEVVDEWNRATEQHLTSEQLAKLAGAIGGMSVMRTKDTDFSLRAQSEAGQFFNDYYFDPNTGKPHHVYMANWHVNDGAPAGFGTAALATLAEEAKRQGFQYISMYAAGDVNSPLYSGYYTWARLGFDGRVDQQDIRNHLSKHFSLLGNAELISKIPPEFFSYTKISQFMATPEGRDFWRQYGTSFLGELSLTDDSPGLKTLRAYTRERGLKIEAWIAEAKKKLAGNLCVNTGDGSGGGFTACNIGGSQSAAAPLTAGQKAAATRKANMLARAAAVVSGKATSVATATPIATPPSTPIVTVPSVPSLTPPPVEPPKKTALARKLDDGLDEARKMLRSKSGAQRVQADNYLKAAGAANDWLVSQPDARDIHVALEYYTGRGTRSIRAIDKGLAGGPQQVTVDRIYKLINNAPKFDGTSYRGRDFVSPEARIDFLKRAVPGAVMSFAALSSTSVSRSVANIFTDRHGLMYEIHGKSGVAIGPMARNIKEHEVLFGKHSKFKIVKVTSGYPPTVVLEEISDHIGPTIREAKKRLGGNLCVNTGDGSGGGFIPCDDVAGFGTTERTIVAGFQSRPTRYSEDSDWVAHWKSIDSKYGQDLLASLSWSDSIKNNDNLMEAIDCYVSTECQESFIHSHLTGEQKTNSFFRRDLANTIAAIGSAPTTTNPVYRGMKLFPEFEAAMADFAAGKEASIAVKTFTSTSLNSGIAATFAGFHAGRSKPVVLEIKGKSGHVIAGAVPNEAKSEAEVVFLPGTRFKITKVETRVAYGHGPVAHEFPTVTLEEI